MPQILRRTVLGAPLLLLARPALAAPIGAWRAYERRLQAGLNDAAGGAFDADFEDVLLDLNTLIRKGQGLAGLAPDSGLTLAARAHAADIVRSGVFDHATADGFTPAGRVGLLARDLIGAPGENIAMRRNASGPVMPDQIMNQWRNSPGHRANLLAPGFTHVGYGVVRQGPRVIAVGAYAEVSARLQRPAPLRVTSVDQIAATLTGATPTITQFSVSAPDADVLTTPYVEGRPPLVLPPGAWQLRPHLASGPHRYQVAWGPVFFLE